jgi:ribosome-binding protein aMBF1 (putative translation factor)
MGHPKHCLGVDRETRQLSKWFLPTGSTGRMNRSRARPLRGHTHEEANMADSSIRLTDRTPAGDRDRRERLGISVDDLAAQAGITPQELTTYEQAKSAEDAIPSISGKVSDALDALEAAEPEDHPT